MLNLGDLAHLPSSPPDAMEFRAQIQAAEAEDKAPKGDVPRGTEADGLDALPPMAGPMGMAPALAPGTKVRDMLSGQTGVVAAPPSEGDWGEVVFVKLDTDGVTHPFVSKYLEAVPMAPPASPMTPPAPLGAPAAAPPPKGTDEGAPAPDSPIPAKPTVTNAALHRRLMNARLSTPVKASAQAPAPTPAKPSAVQTGILAAADHADPIITHPSDARRLRYSALKARLKASPTPTHSDALSLVGYVPAGWDLLAARLMSDGVILRSAKGDYDVAAMVNAGFSEREIRYVLGSKGVPMYALDRAFKALKIDGSARGSVFTAAGVASFRKLYELGAEYSDADVVAEMRQFNVADLPKAWIKADAPTMPMPTEDPGQGMAWAWDKTAMKWYETAKAA